MLATLRLRIAVPVLGLMLLSLSSAAPPVTQNPLCTVPATSPDPGNFDLRWAGLTFDAFTLDGNTFWTAGDGGRLRSFALGGASAFAPTPLEVRDTLRNVFFLNTSTGWAVGVECIVRYQK